MVPADQKNWEGNSEGGGWGGEFVRKAQEKEMIVLKDRQEKVQRWGDDLEKGMGCAQGEEIFLWTVILRAAEQSQGVGNFS